MDYYHKLYLKSDALLLSDVFENFKKNVFRNLWTRPRKALGLAWEEAL